MKNNTLAIFACGGTIDKIYFDAKSSYSVGAPSIDDIFRRAGANLGAARPLLKKDSLDMTDADRAAVAAAVRDCEESRVVVTHGTDTMADTARAVAAAVGGGEKTVVFTGAFLPAVFRDSDADFNAGFAVAAALSLPSGVYVAMNGKILPAAAARKNRAAGRFEAESV